MKTKLFILMCCLQNIMFAALAQPVRTNGHVANIIQKPEAEKKSVKKKKRSWLRRHWKKVVGGVGTAALVAWLLRRNYVKWRADRQKTASEGWRKIRDRQTQEPTRVDEKLLPYVRILLDESAGDIERAAAARKVIARRPSGVFDSEQEFEEVTSLLSAPIGSDSGPSSVPRTVKISTLDLLGRGGLVRQMQNEGAFGVRRGIDQRLRRAGGLELHNGYFGAQPNRSRRARNPYIDS